MLTRRLSLTTLIFTAVLALVLARQLTFRPRCASGRCRLGVDAAGPLTNRRPDVDNFEAKAAVGDLPRRHRRGYSACQFSDLLWPTVPCGALRGTWDAHPVWFCAGAGDFGHALGEIGLVAALLASLDLSGHSSGLH